MLKNVVLPAPFGPISETTRPRGTVKSTSFTATSPPNSFRTFSATRTLPLSVMSSSPGVRDVVERLVVHAFVHLRGDASRRDQALRSEQHHDQDDQPVDPGGVQRHVDVRAP